MAYKFVNPTIGQDEVTVTNTYATSANVYPRWAFGQTALATDPTLGAGEFIYAAGGANVAAGNIVVFRGHSVSQLATASNGSAGRVGVVYAPLSASNVGGWVQVRGFASPVTISTTGASGQLCMIGSTAGCVQVTGPTATTFANPIDGMIIGSSCSASTAAGVVHLNYPSIRGA